MGANCTIVCGNTLGKHSLIGSGAVICKDVDAYSIMVGNPGKKIGEIDFYCGSMAEFVFYEASFIHNTRERGAVSRLFIHVC